MQYISSGYGRRIASARLRRGLTQEQLADAVHMDRSHLSKVEAGTRSCSVDYIAEIAVYLNVSLDYLILGQKPCYKSDDVADRLDEVIAQLTELRRKL